MSSLIPVPESLARSAWLDAAGYDRLYAESLRDPEKFWGEPGAEAMLQLRADHLSEDRPLEAFWERRQAAATGQRPYRRAG